MRGLLAIAIGLIALQVVTTSSLPELPAALAYPAGLVAKWMDPTVPLLGSSASSAGSPSAGAPAATPAQSAAAAQGAATAGLAAPPAYLTHIR